jgi:phage-related protein
MSEYRVAYYEDSKTGQQPVVEYIDGFRHKERLKIFKTIETLRAREGRLPEPYSKHVGGKIWELRIQFSPLAHRILYVALEGKLLLMLHGFTKKTEKLPAQELERAMRNYQDALTNLGHYYEKSI